MNIKQSIFNNKKIQAGLGYTIGNYLLKGINLLTLPIFARLMTVQDYGTFNLYMSYEGIMVLLIGLALHSSLKNAWYDYGEKYKEYLSTIMLIPQIMLIIFLVVFNIFSSFFADILSINHTLLNILLIHSYCSSVIQVYNGKLSLTYEYKKFLSISFLNTITNVLLSLVLMGTIMRTDKYLGRVIGSVIPLILITIYILANTFKSSKPISKKKYASYGLKYSLPIVPHGLSQIILAQFDRIMINRIVGVTEAGIYSFAYNITTIIQIFITSLDTVFGPWYYEKIEKKEYDKIKKISSMYIYLIWMLIICVILVVPEIILILGGEKYVIAKKVAIPLICSVFFSFMYLLPATSEYYMKKTGTIALTTSAAALLNIVLNSIFITSYGYVAAAYTTLFCYICYFLFHYYVAKKIMKKQQFNTKIIVFLSALLICFMIFYQLFELTLLSRIIILIVFLLMNAIVVLFILKKSGRKLFEK